MTNLIGISGRLQSGKDLTARIIQYLTYERNKYCLPKFKEPFDPDYDYSGWNVWDTPDSCHLHPWEIRKFATALKQVASILTGIPVGDFEKQEVKESFLNEEWNTIIRGDIELSPYGSTWREETSVRMSVRELLQKLGTDAIRNNVHQNSWVNALMSQYKPEKISQHNPSKWIISDTRFPNEFDAVKERRGIMIRVNRNNPYNLWTPANGDQVWIKVFSNWSFGTYIGKDADNINHLVREPKEGGGNLYKSSKILPEEADPNNNRNYHSSETALDNFEFDYEIDNSGSIEELVEKVREILIKEKII